MTSPTSLLVSRSALTSISKPSANSPGHPKGIDLIVIDESERLRPSAIEYLRDRYDRTNTGLILIGMPGIEQQFSRYHQLYSRVSFAPRIPTTGRGRTALRSRTTLAQTRPTFDPDDYTEAQAIAAIARITRGNSRRVDRLFTQIERVMTINELNTITDDVVEAARSTLVVGLT